jgi:Bacterial regulatory proteins, gntR family/Cro/C1-type HTH DNA-binding domain
VNAAPDIADQEPVLRALRDRMRELGMSTAELARRTGLSETTIRGIGHPGKTNGVALTAISAVLRWRYDYLTNIARGVPEKNVRITPPPSVTLERAVRAELEPLKEEIRALKETVLAMESKLDALNSTEPPAPAREEAPLTSLPGPGDMDADYSPQYVKLARRLRIDIQSGALRHRDKVRAASLSAQYGVSGPVACAALRMLAANGYLDKPDRFHAYAVTDRRALPVQKVA